MRNNPLAILSIIISYCLFFLHCADNPTRNDQPQSDTTRSAFGGFESQVKFGEHLVIIGACHDCHTPKKMSAHGMDLDSSLLLSGHHSKFPKPDVNRGEMEGKGLVVTNDLTSWVGPWGISFTANLTSHETGIGTWKEEQFIYALRNGKYKGLPDSRPLLPPMPWQMYQHMTDDELKAIFAYLKTTTPIENVVPPPVPPARAGQKK